MRLWDPEPLRAALRQIQTIRPLFDFLDVDVDRYDIGGQYKQVMLSARELDPSRLPVDAQTWVNSRLQFTHGYGYAVAEDRLFQMEMAKRSVLGTTAEVLGEASLEHDRLTRSGFDPESIHRQIQALPQEDRDILEGYAEGFNQRIDDVLADRGNLLPQQFTDYGFEPSRWTGYDVAMIWIGTMANRFSDSTSEVANLQVRDRLVSEHGQDKGQELFDQILWTEDPTARTTDPRTDHPRPEVPGEMPYDRPGRALGPQPSPGPPFGPGGIAWTGRFSSTLPFPTARRARRSARRWSARGSRPASTSCPACAPSTPGRARWSRRTRWSGS